MFTFGLSKFRNSKGVGVGPMYLLQRTIGLLFKVAHLFLMFRHPYITPILPKPEPPTNCLSHPEKLEPAAESPRKEVGTRVGWGGGTKGAREVISWAGFGL